ncbi:hypothetical protein D3C72_1399140 [compost metagenome]
MHGGEDHPVLLESPAHVSSELTRDALTVGIEVTQLEPVVASTVFIDRRHEVVGVHQERFFVHRCSVAAVAGRGMDPLDDRVRRVTHLVVLQAIATPLELQILLVERRNLDVV